MIILLPPSEGKTRAARGEPMRVADLAFPGLLRTRETVSAALVRMCARPEAAAEALGVGPRLVDEVADNTSILARPAAPAIEVYSGVLYEALSFGTLPAAARRRADDRLAIASALWGLVRPSDRITSYRLSAGARLPRLGVVDARWRRPVSTVLAASDGLIVDLRSGAYAAMGPVPGTDTERAVSVRVLHDVGGRLAVVSHHNKATKGRIARALLAARSEPGTAAELATVLTGMGFSVMSGAARRGPAVLDVVVDAV